MATNLTREIFKPVTHKKDIKQFNSTDYSSAISLLEAITLYLSSHEVNQFKINDTLVKPEAKRGLFSSLIHVPSEDNCSTISIAKNNVSLFGVIGFIESNTLVVYKDEQ